jgi:hypothetical protein
MNFDLDQEFWINQKDDELLIVQEETKEKKEEELSSMLVGLQKFEQKMDRHLFLNRQSILYPSFSFETPLESLPKATASLQRHQSGEVLMQWDMVHSLKYPKELEAVLLKGHHQSVPQLVLGQAYNIFVHCNACSHGKTHVSTIHFETNLGQRHLEKSNMVVHLALVEYPFEMPGKQMIKHFKVYIGCIRWKLPPCL